MKKIILLLFLLSSFVLIKAQCWKILTTKYGHTIAMDTANKVWSWGDNGGYDVLGIPAGDNSVNTKLPHQVGKASDWLTVSTGDIMTLALKKDSSLWGWGRYDGVSQQSDTSVQISPDHDWKLISGGWDFCAAIKSNGTLWTWGENNHGELGNGNTTNRSAIAQVGTDNDWKYVVASYFCTIAIKTNGTLWAWGDNQYGEIGDGTNTDRHLPVQIGTASDWKMISAEDNHCLALKNDGSLWGWGYNFDGEVGDGTTSNRNAPVQIGTDVDWATISAATNHSLAVKSNGTLWAWGNNLNGQLGNGTEGYEHYFTPQPSGSLTNWTNVFAGYFYSFGERTDGSFWAWGWNTTGQLGDGTINQQDAPESLVCSSATLPITLTFFTAQKQHETTLLNWQTETEQNNKEYQVERSSDGNTFNKIGVVASNNSSSGSHYSYIDEHPLTGNNYYRLKSIDIDGKFSYSNIDEITFNLYANNVIVYPNPAKDILTVQSNFRGEKLNITITDLAGRKILQTTKQNNQQIEIPLSDLKAGFYLIKINDGITSVSKKIIKE